jgi:hypothetical protein
LLTEQKSEVSISDDISSVEEVTEKDPGFMRSHRAYRSQDSVPAENSFMPIVSVEDFFSILYHYLSILLNEVLTAL